MVIHPNDVPRWRKKLDQIEVFDARQSGLSDLKLARLIEDFDWVQRARRDAFALVEADPELDDPAHRRLRQEVLARLGDGRAEWLARG